tara:strand:- start:977 stop:1186 length:210 start_codon:yes stop_codon:yes gene_type:complete
MNEILELISKVSVEVNDDHVEAALNQVAVTIKQLHKDQVIAAYNRGAVSVMEPGGSNAEAYYTKNYEQI